MSAEVTLPALLRAEQAATLCGVGKRTWWRLVSSGTAPKPVRLGGSVRWRHAEVMAWIEHGCRSCRSRKGHDGASS